MTIDSPKDLTPTSDSTKCQEGGDDWLPNLIGKVDKERVQTIGTGKYQATYLNWARTFNILRENNPDWLVECGPGCDGTLLHRAPVGAYLMLRLRNIRTGQVTPYVPQAVMDNRNQSIQWDKISSRDITDTQRRGGCLLLAQQTGLASELWAKDPLESGYHADEQEEEPRQEVKPKVRESASPKSSEGDFKAAAKAKGLNDGATETILKSLREKKVTNFSAAINSLSDPSRTAEWVASMNKAHEGK
jgi:hypothetical protein